MPGAQVASTMPEQRPGSSHGRHVLLDYLGFHEPPAPAAQWMLETLGEAVAAEGVHEVHRHAEVLGAEGRSPPGFTAVVLIDESHLTAHCYSEQGWLALDCFTCGSHDPERIADRLHEAILARAPTVRLLRRTCVERFLDH